MERPSRRFLGIAAIAAGFFYLLWLHGQFMLVMPDPIFQPDSGGYMGPVLEFLAGKGFHVPAYRTWGYPLWLLFWLAPTHNFHHLLLAQHGVGLGTALMTGMLAYRFFSVSKGNALAIAFFTATLPRLLIYSHVVLTDVMYAGSLIVNVFLLLKALQAPTIKRWALVAIGAWIGLLFRPVGLSFILVAGLLLGFQLIRGRQRKAAVCGALIFLVLYVSTCAMNLKVRGFWGLDQFAGISLFGTAAPYLSPELKGADANWVRYDPAGPVARLRMRYPEPGLLNQRLLQLSYGGIRRHPIRFIRDQVILFGRFLWFASARPTHLYSKAWTMARGQAFYAEQVKAIPQAPALSFRVALKPLYPYEPTPLTYPLWPWVFLIRWVGLAALLVTPFLAQKKELRGPLLTVWLVIIAHILASNLGGDSDGRHALPIEPLFVLLAFSGLGKAAELIWIRLRCGRRANESSDPRGPQCLPDA